MYFINLSVKSETASAQNALFYGMKAVKSFSKQTTRSANIFEAIGSRIILQTYLNRVYTGPDKDEIQKQISENKDFSLSEAALNEFEKYLNEHIPEFENGMYDRISVERSDGNTPDNTAARKKR